MTKEDPTNDENSTNERSFICKKNLLTNILRFELINYKKLSDKPQFMDILIDAVERTNKIVFQTYLFLKMYFLWIEKNIYMRENDPIVPNINKEFIRKIMNTITYKINKRGSKGSKNKTVQAIQKFYDNHFSMLLKEEDMVNRDYLSQILDEEADDIVTNIKNNISQHFKSHLQFFIKVKYGFDKKLEKIDKSKNSYKVKKDLKDKIYEEMKTIINDIIDVSKDRGIKFQSPKKYHEDIIHFNNTFIPHKKTFSKAYVFYDVKAHPTDYVIQMIRINQELEKVNDEAIGKKKHVNYKKIDQKNNNKKKKNRNKRNRIKNKKKKKIIKRDAGKDIAPYRLFNALPLRTEIVPKNITLGTVGLIDLFITDNKKEYRDNSNKYRKIIWKKFFKINTINFWQDGYTFNYMIKTDGVSASIVLTRYINEDEIVDKDYVPYIDEIAPEEFILDNKKSFVYLDPGKNDIFNAMKVNDNDYKYYKYRYFKYSQRNRNHHTKKIKYRNIREGLCTQKIINNKTVKDIESSLMDYNSKTCNYDKFKEYAKKKIEVNRLLFDFYSNSIFRKLNFNTYTNTRRNEDLMMEKFKKAMGSPKEVIVILGDWSKGGMRGTEPSITKKLRRIIQGKGYELYLIDEHKTSKLCSSCHEPTECLRMPNNPNPLWKVVRCTSCGATHNRDHNAPKNMMFITEEILKGNERPEAFQRKNK